MAYRCTFGEHRNCASCGTFVPAPQRDHVHVYRGGSHSTEIVCATCWLLICLASKTILQALGAAGVKAADVESFAAFVTRHVTIGIDLPFDFSEASRN